MLQKRIESFKSLGQTLLGVGSQLSSILKDEVYYTYAETWAPGKNESIVYRCEIGLYMWEASTIEELIKGMQYDLNDHKAKRG